MRRRPRGHALFGSQAGRKRRRFFGSQPERLDRRFFNFRRFVPGLRSLG